MHVDYPFHFDARGRTGETNLEDHVRDLVEQVLFTTPGERVNRPDLGSGLLQMTFAPNSEELAAATQFLVQGALQKWLADAIVIDAVRVEAVENEFRVLVSYTIRRTQQRRQETFRR
jgi:phage baseplate assembly protein W